MFTSKLFLRALFLLLSFWFAASPALAAQPSASTAAATSITTSSAALNGTGTPANEATTGWFRISASNPGTCNDTFGTRVPTTSGTDLGAGAVAVAYSISATGLASGSTYYYCAIVENATGKAFGTIQSFSVPGAPLVTTTAETLLLATSATLNADSTPLGASATGWFRYHTSDPGACNDTFGTRAPTSSGSSLGSGFSSVSYNRAISGLVPNTTYWFCAIVNNAYGTTFGSVRSFTTPPALPTASTNTTTNVTGATVTLNGSSVPNGATTTAWFRYSSTSPGTCNDSFGTRAPSSGGSNLGAGNASLTFSENITGLTQGVTYYACAITQNSVGTTLGNVVTFTTPAPPTAVTAAATSISNTSATLNGSGIPNRALTTGWFRYSATNPVTCNDSFGSRTPTTGGSNLGSGTSSIAIGQFATDLSPATTYYFCAITQNAEGTAFGSVLSFTTLAPPTAVTNATTVVTATGATLNGTANPNGASTIAWHRYSTTNPGTCNDTFGTRAPTSGFAMGSGTSALSIGYAISGLIPNTTYYSCAIANNGYGTTFGSVLSFTTLPAPPTANTSTTTSVTGASATLNGSGNPGGAATTGWFRYATVSPGTCNDTFGTRAPSSDGSNLGSGNASIAFSENLTGLSQGTTYYACAITQNSVGTALGNIVQFTTASPPTVATSAATSLGNTTVTLNGSGVPNRALTTGWFRYSATNPGTCNDTFGSRYPTSGGSNLGSSTSTISFSQSPFDLSPLTTYYFCAITQNSEGTAFGSMLSFTTLAAPTAVTTAATSITATGATLNGTANPNGATTTAWHRYSTVSPGTCNASFGTQVPPSGFSMGSGTAALSIGYAISGLTPNTTYYSCAFANNAYGLGFGAVTSFTTLAAVPTANTSTTTNVTGASATLNGNSNPGGAATTAWFRYATVSPGTCNDTFGTRAPSSSGSVVGSGNTSVTFSENITGLSQGTTYYACAITQNSVGIALGSVVQFTTPSPPTATTSAATGIGNTYASLNGAGVPNRATTTGWFRYSSTNPGTCDDSFGSRLPTTSGTNLGSSTSTITYGLSASGLTAGTTYYFCAITQNGEGTAFGSVLSFTTVAAPTVVTNAETSLTATGATLNGTANPNGAATTGWHRYSATNPGTCNDTFGTRAPASGFSVGSGTTPVGIGYAITGLTPTTTYYFCSIAQNSYGTAFGSVLSFTTSATPPTANTSATTNVTGVTATLNGSSSPGGASTTAWFRYSTVSPGTCNDTFGTRAPSSGGTSLGSGIPLVSFSENLTGLSQGTTYYVCAIAQNSVGTTVGNLTSFSTPLPPTAVTGSAQSIGNTYASLNGSGIPNRATTTGWFRYSATDPGACNDTFGSRLPTSSGASLGAGTSSIAYVHSASNLSPDTTYYYCAITQNAEGTAFGSVLSFTTLAAPTVVSLAAVSITATGATLNGTTDPNGSSTVAWYRLATTDPGTCNDTVGTRVPASGLAAGGGTSAVNIGYATTGLIPNTTYYYCPIAQNTFGYGYGTVLSFTTLAAAPTASTGSATNVAGTTATLNGSANPGGSATTGWFRYATANPGTCNDTFGTRVPGSGGSSLGSGTAGMSFSENLTGLSQGTTYYACAITQNSVGTTLGNVVSFTTASPPTVTTSAATGLASTYAALNGSGVPNRATTTGWFRYSSTNPGTCNDTFGSRYPTSGGSNLGASTSTINFSQSPSNLSPLTTYYFCAITQNSEGTAFGSVLSFTTLAAPTVVTNAATSITAAGATLNGTANPNGAVTTGWHRYSTTNPGTCNDTFGTRVPTSGLAAGSGTSATSIGYPVSGLAPNTTYYHCAIANNGYGTRFGSLLSFTTLPAAPTASTSSATSVTTSSARLNGSSNPGGAVTTAWFRYSATNPGACNDTFGTRAPSTGGTDVGSGLSSVGFSQDITGLTQGTIYYFCAITMNSAGTTVGNLTSFSTQTPPQAATLAATPVTSTTATLNGTADANGFTTTSWFRYSTLDPGICNDTFGTRAPSSGSTSIGSGTSPVAYSQAISGLTAATTYYSCAIASSSVGTAFGEVLSFTTSASLPTVSTVAASEVTTTTATLNGSSSPGGATTTGWFRYATVNPGTCSDSFGTRLPASGGTNVGSGNQPVPFDESITGLSSGVTYYYCAIASNVQGTSLGGVASFTPSPAPSVTTNAATSVSSTGATLNASANPNASTTTGWFRYSSVNPGACNDSFGIRAPSSSGTSLGSGSSASTYTETLTGLTPNTTYYYCGIAQNLVGTGTGGLQSFTTGAAPTVSTDGATAVAGTTATLNGSANPRATTTVGWFRYATVDPGTCSDSFGTRAPGSSGTSLGSGTSSAPFAEGVTGLSPGTTYYFCAIAQNGVGTSFGSVSTFTTLAAPTVTTNVATSVTNAGVTLNGSADPNLADAAGWFRYSTTNPGTCDDSFGTPTSADALGAGSTAVGFTEGVTGLVSGTTYFFCAISQNAVGTSFGAVLSFTTLAAPNVQTDAATVVGSAGATLNATANPNGTLATGWFRYDSVSPGTCNDSFGTRAPVSLGTNLGAGTAGTTYSMAVTGLSAGTTYYYCAIASNTAGLGLGAVLSFTTTAGPIVVTDDATNVLGSSATLAGTANPNNLSATGWFRYSETDPGTCDDSFGTRAPASLGANLGTGGVGVPYSQDLSGLSPGVTYYYCAIAQNSVATRFGAVRSFTTIPGAEVTTDDATSVDDTTATLNATANPNGADATGWFRYGTSDPGDCDDSFGTRVPDADGTPLGGGTDDVTFTEDLTGLVPDTTYYFCAITETAAGQSFGEVSTFTTAGPPDVTTELATSVTGSGAALNATANPNLLTTSGWFRFSTTSPGTCNDSFGTRVPASDGLTLGSGGSAVGYAQALTGLAPGTTYYFCAIAENSAGLRFGSVRSFTTIPAPSVTTAAATSVSSSSATMEGTANPNGSLTVGWFRYDTLNPGTCNDGFGTRAPETGATTLGSGLVAAPYSETLTGLLPGTTYYYCALAASASGLSAGAVLSFTTTSGPSVSTGDATAVLATTTTLGGSANPNGSATTGWFRYSATDPGACDDSFGTRAPASGGSALGSGTSSADFAQALTGLSASTTYYYCALASSVGGSSYGAVRSFRTADGIAVTTNDATELSGTLATLNGEATPNGAATTGWFRYSATDPGTCDDTFGSRIPASAGTTLGSGVNPVEYDEDLTGLTPGTTYYFCALAGSGADRSYGAVYSFTTPTEPTVTTEAALSVITTGATLVGSSSTGFASTIGWFRYSATDPGTCDDSFGTRAPASGGMNLGSIASNATFSEVLTALSPDTTYYYCALSANSEGTSFGAVLSFTTDAVTLTPTPVVTTEEASDVESTSFTLEGTTDPSGSATRAWFRYDTTEPAECDDDFGTRVPEDDGTDIAANEADPVAFSEALTELDPETTYWFCAIAENANGLGFGEPVSVTTQAEVVAPEPTLPVVVTDAASGVETEEATLNASVEPGGAATTAWFRYSETEPDSCDDEFGTRLPETDGTEVDATATEPVDVTRTLTDLEPGTTYYFCALAENLRGTVFGELRSFVTDEADVAAPEPVLPSVTTGAAEDVTTDEAELSASVNPNGTDTTAWFRYSTTEPAACDDSFGTRVPDQTSFAIGEGTADVPVSEVVSGAPGTTHYFCAIAENAAGLAFGELQSFTLGTPLPVVTTEPATEVGETSATLVGSANPSGFATTGWFRLGTTDPGDCTDDFGQRVPAEEDFDLGNGTAALGFEETTTALEPATTYYYCAVAASPGGTSFGTLATFTTGAALPIVTTEPPTLDAEMAVRLNGTADPRGSDTTGWFRYDAVDPGSCNDAFGTRIPTEDGVAIGSGRAPLTFVDTAGQVPDGTIYVCAIAENAAGVAFGAVVPFVIARTPTDEMPSDMTVPASCACRMESRSRAPGMFLVGMAFVALVLARRQRRS